MQINSKSAVQTKKIAAQLAKKILESPSHKNHARVIGLVGDLGAGKTTFTQGFAKALGIKNRMVSPTFLIFRRYEIPKLKPYNLNLTTFYHVDVYRIKKISELKTIHFDKILANPKNIVLVEWADQIKKVLPKDTVWIRFEHGKKENERIVSLRGV